MKYFWRKIAAEYAKLCGGFYETGLVITQGFVMPSHCFAELLPKICIIREDGRQRRKNARISEKVSYIEPETKPIEGT